MTIFAGALFLATLGAVSHGDTAHAVGVIETPKELARQSGIGLFSGWYCGADLVEIRIDGGEPMRAASGTPRSDTRPVCGRTDTGWSLLYNFGLLDPTVQHDAVAYADGVEFARVRFRTTSFGVEFLRDRSASCEVLNFPDLGERTTLAWSEERQNFSIASTSAGSSGTPAPSISGTYHGGITLHGPGERVVHPGIFTVNLRDSDLSVTLQRVGGTTCTFTVRWRLEGTNVVDNGRAGTDTCNVLGGFFFLRIDGKRIHGGVFDLGGLLFEGVKVGA
jgi:hypothetical protein